MKNFFRRTLTALLIVAGLVTASFVGATVKMYTATGEGYAWEDESQDIAKLRARDKAIKNATKEAGVYLKTYSRSVNNELTDDEVLAITSNSWQLVGEPKFTRSVKQISDETAVIVWTATVEVNVDDAELQSWLKRDDKDKSTIITQTNAARTASEENERTVEDLRERYNQATSQTERDKIRQQMNDADRDFLANQKLEEGFRLYYAQNYDGAMKICNEVIQYHPNFAWAAYSERGLIYFGLKQYKKAVSDFSKTIKLKPNWTYISAIYVGRASAYALLNEHIRAFADFSSAININPNLSEAYIGRGVIYAKDLNRPDLAMEDFDKAIQINPNSSEAYIGRGIIYMDVLKQYTLAIIEFNNAIKSNPNSLEAYISRCVAYAYMKNFKQAVDDATKAIQINPNYATAYHFRGLCYLGLRDKEKAQADFARAKQLGYNG